MNHPRYKIWSENDRPGTITTIATTYNLVPLFSDNGDMESRDEAEKLFRETLRLRKKFFEDGDSDMLASMHNLATLLSVKDDLGSRAEAEELFRETLQLWKIHGIDDLRALATLYNLDVLLSSIGDSRARSEAEELSGELQKNLQGDSSDTLVPMYYHAIWLSADGELERLDEAEELYDETLQRCKEIFGNEHPYTLASMEILAELLRTKCDFEDDMGLRDRAEELYRELLQLRRKVLGDEHPDTVMTMKYLEMMLHHSDDQDMKNKMIKMFEMHKNLTAFITGMGVGANDDELVFLLNNSMESRDEAKRLFEDVLKKVEKNLGEEHPLNQHIKECLAKFDFDEESEV